MSPRHGIAPYPQARFLYEKGTDAFRGYRVKVFR